ncbi:MAG: hypothetical protein ACRC2H_00850, partial [Silanimonas sp.]
AEAPTPEPAQSRPAVLDNAPPAAEPAPRRRIPRPPSYTIDTALRRRLFGRELVLQVEVDGVAQELRGDAFRLLELAQKRADNLSRLAECVTT